MIFKQKTNDIPVYKAPECLAAEAVEEMMLCQSAETPEWGEDPNGF